MNNKLRAVCLTLFISVLAGNLYAQETIFKDLSYPYLEKLIATAKRNYPEVKVKQKQVEIARSTFHQASFGWLEAFSASYIYSPQSSINITQPTIFKGYQLVASVSLGSLFERPYTIHNARESVKVAEFQQQEYFLLLEAQIKHAYFAYLAAQADLRNKVTAVTNAEIATKNLKYTFEKGETTFDVYNAALNNLYNQNSFRIQAELNVFSAKTDLEEYIGDKLESVK
ncbi:TolC family protein [Mucilaginibacter sp. BJC16-A38]|uniref:TolC family protein n=1 Tax=Mucilaginibacter phenanthrenivorans TaxID=1234842 RepID=UPI0021571911|nr:TolC family protein [Mucilaginibacter phenanthrenivorans]MCR8556146.1 TolC family protein [Mucilaginibacter phenanthrenivorans]